MEREPRRTERGEDGGREVGQGIEEADAASRAPAAHLWVASSTHSEKTTIEGASSKLVRVFIPCLN